MICKASLVLNLHCLKRAPAACEVMTDRTCNQTLRETSLRSSTDQPRPGNECKCLLMNIEVGQSRRRQGPWSTKADPRVVQSRICSDGQRLSFSLRSLDFSSAGARCMVSSMHERTRDHVYQDGVPVHEYMCTENHCRKATFLLITSRDCP